MFLLLQLTPTQHSQDSASPVTELLDILIDELIAPIHMLMNLGKTFPEFLHGRLTDILFVVQSCHLR